MKRNILDHDSPVSSLRIKSVETVFVYILWLRTIRREESSWHRRYTVVARGAENVRQFVEKKFSHKKGKN